MKEDFENILKVLQLKMKDYQPCDDKDNELSIIYERYQIPIEEVPVPSLIYLLFVILMRYPLGQRGEKTHWAIPFKYKDISCKITLEKFGIRLYIEKRNGKEPPAVSWEEIIGKIKKAILSIEKKFLLPLAKEQLAQGNVTVANHYHRLDKMFRYFRKQAEVAYKASPELKDNDIASRLNLHFRSQNEGFYNSLAMIDAFFSRLEHQLVLLLPFADFRRESDSLVDFIGANWTDKYKRVLGIDPGSTSKHFYDRLVTLKERFRNTFAHGGFEKQGASLYFHLPEVGAVPASLTSIKQSPNFKFVPMEEANFQEICSLFDRFDMWITQEKMIYGMLYIDSGLDIAFDEKSIEEISNHCSSVDTLKEWIIARCHYIDMIENADY